MSTRVKALSLEELEQRARASDVPGTLIVSPDEWYALFDDAVRKYMDMSAEEFIARWEAGEYDQIADTAGHRHIIELASYIPTLERQNS